MKPRQPSLQRPLLPVAQGRCTMGSPTAPFVCDEPATVLLTAEGFTFTLPYCEPHALQMMAFDPAWRRR